MWRSRASCAATSIGSPTTTASLLRTADEQSRQAETANRLKDEFLSTLSHELRTPLNSVLGWARLLAGGKLDAAQTARAVQAIERAGWAQSRLIEDLLDVSRIVAGKLDLNTRPIVVPPLVEAAVESLRPAAEAKRIVVDVRDRRIARSDRRRRRPPAAGGVEPGLERHQVHADRRPRQRPPDLETTTSFVRSCPTSGVGFSPDVAAHLFERFRQGDASSTRQHGGLGLGLGIVRHVVELHGGTVTAASAGEGLGSTFEVCIPLRPWTAPMLDPPRAEPHAPSLRGVTVLVVDDDRDAREFARTTLEQYGAIVVTAASAAEAKARFRREPPDVFVSDLAMPDEDGLQLIRDIRQLERVSGRVTPAAALTALVRSDDRRRALSAGYQMHMAKPIDPSELVSAVEHLAQPPEH